MTATWLWPALAAAVGLASAAVALRRAQRVDAVLALVAAAALALLLAGLQSPAGEGGTVRIASEPVPEAARAAARLELAGDGLRAAAWHDLPARPLQWRPTDEPAIALDFPRRLPLGRSFELTLRRSAPLPAWRLQLLDENGHLLAEAPATGAQARVRWLPPLPAAMLLQARTLDAAGKTLEQGPVPVQVRAATPMQVLGRFGAPSFDVQALNSLLVASQAVLDWQVTLGKALTRSETPRSAMAAPDLLVIDAAHFERATPAARRALLAPVGQGAPLLVLGANASDAALWARELQLPLVPQATDPPRSLRVAPELELPGTALAPSPGAVAAGPWTARADGSSWQRPWQAGRIVWLGVSDWHRAAISAPQALGEWWQAVLDDAGVQRPQALDWHFPEAVPLAGERTLICVRGADASLSLRLPALQQALPLQRRADQVDAACAATWPLQPGWLDLATDAPALPAGRLYVFAPSDWPAWQRGLRREATERYAARQPSSTAPQPRPWPAWPAALAFTLAMLALWWRERRAR